MKLITPFELRANPGLRRELRGEPEGFIERRFIAPTLELRAADEGSDAIYKGGGLAIVYNSRSEDLGGFIEVIRPGAARDVLAKDPDVRALYNHDPNYVLGRTRAGTLRLAEQDDGTAYEFDAPDVSYARDLKVLFDRGDVNQSSFAFTLHRDDVEWQEDAATGLLLRIIHRFAGLYDVSPVTYPAYPAATSGVRSDASGTTPEEAAADAAAALDEAQALARAARARLGMRSRRLR